MEGSTRARPERWDAYAILEALYAGAPVGMGFWDTELRFQRLNHRLAEINGMAPEEHIGRRPAELLGEVGEMAESAFRRVLETRSPILEMQISGETPAHPGRTCHWLMSAYPVLGHAGEPYGVGAVVIEVTDRFEASQRDHAELDAAQSARERAETLSRASSALASTMRADRVLAELVRAVVPTLADYCAIHLAQADGSPELMASTAADPSRAALARELGLRQVTEPERLRGPRTVIETGRREVYEVLSEAELREAAPEDEVHRLVTELQIRSALVLPLKARGKVLGALTLIMGASGRRYEPELVDLAESVAALSGLALDNAQLFAEQAQVAQTLQRMLLPRELPDVPGAVLAARYRPAGRANQVGGDFYDVYPADEGEWAVVIGDVVGKGAEAASITALVRATLQAAVMRGDGPEDALRLVDEALRRRDTLQFCSAVHGRMRRAPGGGLDIHLLIAGHPPPLVLRAEGALEVIENAGTLLGVSPHPEFGEVRLHLAPGDALLLYTDGATELRGGDRWRGDAALRETLLTATRGSLHQLVERIEHETLVLSGGELRDDMALLAVEAAH